MEKWNRTPLNDFRVRNQFQMEVGNKLERERVLKLLDSEGLSCKLKNCITEVQRKFVEKKKGNKTAADDTRNSKKNGELGKAKKYPQGITESIRRSKEVKVMCRKAKEDFYNQKCEELEELDRIHSPRLYTKVRDMKKGS